MNVDEFPMETSLPPEKIFGALGHGRVSSVAFVIFVAIGPLEGHGFTQRNFFWVSPKMLEKVTKPEELVSIGLIIYSFMKT